MNQQIIILKDAIASIFEPIIGQESAKRRIEAWALGGAAGDGYLQSLLITGEPGRGKTRILNAIVDVLRVCFPEKVGTILKVDKGEELGSLTSFVADIVRAYISEKNGALIVDECHGALKKTMGFVRSMIQPDVQRSAVIIKHDDGELIIDPKKFTFVFATNEVNKLDSAFRSRVLEIALEEYSDDEMARILFLGAESNGIKFHEDSLKPLAQTCRGTARDVGSIVNDLVGLLRVAGKTTVNKDNVKELLKLRSLLPLGVNQNELRTILAIEKSGELQLQELACRNGLTSAQQKTTEIYLFRRGLMTVSGKRNLTVEGHLYLAELRKHDYIPAKPTPLLSVA